jgi:protein-S-isoprenylcysteine O-methyltransferase Ste14
VEADHDATKPEVSATIRTLLNLARAMAGSAAYAGLAFLGAGTFDWPRGWLYAIVFAFTSVAGSLILFRVNPGLIEARAKGIRKDTKPFDRIFFAIFVPLVLSEPLVAGADAVRYSWQPLPLWTVYPGIMVFLTGSALTTWTMLVNPYAETTVRIQHERNQVVVASGPYRFVRHPMYLGTVIGFPAAALVLGSAWALIPAMLLVALFAWRTVLEERTLRQELTGYDEYTRNTRFRWFPGLW